MKKLTLSSGFLFLLSFFIYSCNSGKQVAAFNPDLEEAITSGKWIFKADQANPQSGNNRNLDAGYEVKCSKEKLVSYLPYFGRSYSGAGAYTNQSPLDFKTGDFSITKEKGKKNSWVLVIRPADVPEIREFRMIVFNNGTATLDVQFNNRTPITFSGRLEVSQ